MNYVEHGISVGLSRINDEIFLKMKVVGKLSHDDYQKFLPMIERALQETEQPHVKLLFDATEFDGWELKAAWDDLKFGLEHKKAFTKIAFVGSKTWEKIGLKVTNWFMSGEMEYFEDYDKAIDWLQS